MTCTREKILIILADKHVSTIEKINQIKRVLDPEFCKCIPLIIDDMAKFSPEKLRDEIGMDYEEAKAIASYFYIHRADLSKIVAEKLVKLVHENKREEDKDQHCC